MRTGNFTAETRRRGENLKQKEIGRSGDLLIAA